MQSTVAAGDERFAGKQAVEEGKKQFAGFELPGRTLGVIGLGKIGGLVADTAIKLGMKVLGYDPDITVDNAWRLPSAVKRAASIDEVIKSSDFVTLHVPLNGKTRHLVDAKRLARAPRPGAAQLLARRGGRRGGGARRARRQAPRRATSAISPARASRASRA